MTNLGLTYSVDPAEALLNSVWVPVQVIIHHQMRSLEVNTFTRRIGREQNLHFGIMLERLLGFHPFLPAHGAMDSNHGLFATKHRRNAFFEISQSVAVLSEDDELLMK